jgi:hypothetical protein
VYLNLAIGRLDFFSGVLQVSVRRCREKWNDQIQSPWEVIVLIEGYEVETRVFSRGELMGAFGPLDQCLPPQHQKFVYDNGGVQGAMGLFLRKKGEPDVTLVYVRYVAEGAEPGVYLQVTDQLQDMIAKLLGR